MVMNEMEMGANLLLFQHLMAHECEGASPLPTYILYIHTHTHTHMYQKCSECASPLLRVCVFAIQQLHFSPHIRVIDKMTSEECERQRVFNFENNTVIFNTTLRSYANTDGNVHVCL